MAGYTRQSTFADGDTITAALFNNEYNQLLNAFSNTTGHSHDGTANEGPVIGLIGDAGVVTPLNKVLIDSTNDHIEFWIDVSSSAVQQLYIADGAIVPVTDSDVDLGTSSLYFKNAYIDTVTTTGNVAVGGNLTVTGTTTFNGGTITMGDAATDNVVFGADVDSNIIPDDDDSYDLGSSSQEWRNLYIDGTANIDSLVADTADINGGTIDGAIIGGSSAAAITGTAITGTSFVIGSATITEAELEILDGATVTTDELNILDGVTSTAAELNLLDGVTSTTAELNILDGVTASAADINLIDGITNGTVIASKAIITDANKDITGGRNITISGELDAGSLDVSGNVDVDGTLETDALSINGTTVTSTAAELNLLDGKAFLDEDDMSSNSATGIASQQSIKAYVDTQITAEDLDITTDSGTIAIDLDSETLTVSGGTGLDSSATGNAVTLAIDSTVATLTGSQTLTNKSLTAPTLTGTAVVASLDISGDIDVDGTTNLDVVDIDGAVDMASTLTVAGAVAAAGLTVNGDAIIQDATPTLEFKDTDNNFIASIAGASGSLLLKADTGSGTSGESMQFHTGGSQKVTIDASGNVLVGTTNTAPATNNVEGIVLRNEGHINVSRASGIVGYFNRKTDDGTILSFHKDGTAVGSIGSLNGTAYIAGSGKGLRIGSAGLVPATTTGTNSDATYDLGDPSVRFKDLYLSGGVKTGSGLDLTDGSSIFGSIAVSSSSLALNARNTGVMLFQSGGSEKMRIDSSGNLLVGTTNTTLYSATSGGGIYAVPNGSTTIARQSTGSTQPLLILNETGVDGTLQEFRKDGSTVGSIGTVASNIYLGTGDTGIYFNASEDKIYPLNTSTVAGRDAAIDLGKSDTRFKDLYLSSTLYIGSGNGTTTSYISDYEDDLYIYNKESAGKLFLGTNNSTKVTIDSSGNVGIGATPTSKLHVVGSEVLFDNTGGDFTLKLNTNAVGDKNEIVMGDSGTPLAKFGVGGTANDIITGSDGQDFNIGTAGGGRAINFSTDNFGSVEMKLDGGKLGIGTASPANKLHVMGNSSTRNTIVSNVTLDGGTTVANPYEGFGFGVDFIGRDYGNAVRNYAGIYTLMESKSSSSGGGDAGFKAGLSFYTNGGGASGTNPTERMRIDSSGNLLVGKTAIGSNTVGFQVASNGKIAATVSGDETARFNRTTSDGDIIEFRKDDTTVGSIGVDFGSEFYVGGGGGGFYINTNKIRPTTGGDAGTLSDNSHDLGSAAHRFKDLYLSGGAYIGGTAAANKLDDYETGTWSPAFNNTFVQGSFDNATGFSNVNGKYTRIGRKVYCICEFTVTGTVGNLGVGDNFSVTYASLPFSPNQDSGLVFADLAGILTAYNAVGAGLNGSGTVIALTGQSVFVVQVTAVTGAFGASTTKYQLSLDYHV